MSTFPDDRWLMHRGDMRSGAPHSHFLWSKFAQVEAEHLASYLDLGPPPRIIVVGLLCNRQNPGSPIVVQPDFRNYRTDLFDDSIINGLFRKLRRSRTRLRLTKDLYEFGNEKEYDVIDSVDTAYDFWVGRTSIKLDIKRLVERLLATHPSVSRWVSVCSRVIETKVFSGYANLMIAQFPREVYDAQPAAIVTSSKSTTPFRVCLLDRIIDVFFESWAFRIDPLTTSWWDFPSAPEPTHLIQYAAELMMPHLALGDYEKPERRQLFHRLNDIARLKYEGTDCRGSLIFTHSNKADLSKGIQLENPIPLADSRAVRKLLEMTSSDMHLVADLTSVHGLARIPTAGEHAHLYQVSFVDYDSWELMYGSTLLMRVNHGKPDIPKRSMELSDFKDIMKQVFGEAVASNTSRLHTLVLAAAKQKHGTLLIISSDAASEADRLAAQSTPIKPLTLSKKVMSNVTSIDGAVFMDTEGTCFAVGAVLDGLASEQGLPSRGSRYNSALRYVKSRPKGTTLAIVISQDCTVDVLY